jgi:hypothetical protein
VAGEGAASDVDTLASAAEDDGGSGPAPLVFVLGAVALALAAGVVFAVTRSRAAKRRALAGGDE